MSLHSSNPRLETTGDEVHNLNPATGSCKSCAHITDATHWILLEPSVSIETDVLVYEHRTLPGSYECTVSGLRWVCADKVTLQFRLADPEIFKAELVMLQYTPIGPLMDIRVLSGEVVEAHLPHFACLEGSDPSFSDAVRVLRGGSSGMSLEKCAELTRSHAVLRHPSFSLVEPVVKNGFPMRSHVDALIYRTRVEPLTLFIYVVPRDASMITAVEEEGKRIGGKRIYKPRPDAAIRMNAKFSLKSEKAEISPNEITLKYARPPDLFEVFVENAEESIDLKLISDGDTIWQATLRQVDYSEPSGVTESPLRVSAASEPIPTTASTETQPRGRAASRSEQRREEASLSNTATLQYGPTLPGGRNLVGTPRIVWTRKRRHDGLLKDAQGPVSGDIGMAASDMDDALGSPFSASAASEPIPTTASTETRPRGRATSTETQPRGRATSRSEQRREEASLSNKGRVSKVQKELINRGSDGLLRGMLDSLQAEHPSVVSQWEVNEVLQGSRVLPDQWSSLLTMIQNKGEKACGIMLRVLRDLDPLFYEDLGL